MNARIEAMSATIMVVRMTLTMTKVLMTQSSMFAPSDIFFIWALENPRSEMALMAAMRARIQAIAVDLRPQIPGDEKQPNKPKDRGYYCGSEY